jgi:hypothetical protein
MAWWTGSVLVDQRDPFPNAATGYHQIVAIVN